MLIKSIAKKAFLLKFIEELSHNSEKNEQMVYNPRILPSIVMRKFKVKNRQKRKYTRHTEPQSSYPSSTIFAGLLPVLFLAIAFLTTLLMNLNLREQTVSFQPQFTMPQFTIPQFIIPQPSLPEISIPEMSPVDMIKPIQSLPNLFTQPLAFLNSMGILLVTSLQVIMASLGYGFLWILAALDPRPAISAFGAGVQSLIITLGTAISMLIDGFARIGELFAQSLVQAGNNVGAGIQTAWSATMEYTLRGISIIALSIGFVVEKIVWFIMFLFNGIVGILTFLYMQLAAFANAVIRVISIPFQILYSFWLQIKPFFDILGVHIGMVGADLSNGLASFEELATELNE